MSIKDQLRAAILSGGAEGSSEHPSNIVSIQLSSGYVAPANGAIYFNGKANETGGMAVSITKNNGLGSAVTAKVDATWLNSVSLRVRKGDVISFGSYNLSDVHVYFVSLVGGAKSPVAQLFWRAVPCLRNCLTRALTPIADRIEACTTSISRYTLGMGKFTISRSYRQLTAGCIWRDTERCATSLLYRTAFKVRRVKRLQVTRGAPRGFEFAKDRNTRCGRMPARMRSLCSIPTSAHNLCFGGASYD